MTDLSAVVDTSDTLDQQAVGEAWRQRAGAAEDAFADIEADYRRTQIGVLVDALTRQTVVLEQILNVLRSSSEARSSVEISTSTRGIDVKTKAYERSDVGSQVGPAVEAYFEAIRQIEQRVMERQS